MLRLVIILLMLMAGCAAQRPPEPIGPAAPLQPTEQVPPAPAAAPPVEKIEPPAIPEKPVEPAPPVAAKPSPPAPQGETSLARREPVPALPHKPKKPSLPLQELPVPDNKLQSLTRLAETNDKKIMNVYVGMYRKTLEGIMGTAQNPYKRQRITGADGKIYEVLYYLTREPRKGRPINDRMLTPVILRRGQVAAIGNYKLKKLIRTGTLDRHKPPREAPEPSS